MEKWAPYNWPRRRPMAGHRWEQYNNYGVTNAGIQHENRLSSPGRRAELAQSQGGISGAISSLFNWWTRPFDMRLQTDAQIPAQAGARGGASNLLTRHLNRYGDSIYDLRQRIIEIEEQEDEEEDPRLVYRSGRPIMLKSQDDMVADDTVYQAAELDSSGYIREYLQVKRPNGVGVSSGDVGFLGRDINGDNIFIPAQGGTSKDVKAKVSSNDTTTDYLSNQLTATSPLSWSEVNDGSDESYDISLSADLGSQTTVDVVTNVNWDSTNTLLEQTKKTLTFDQYGRLTSVSSGTTTTIDDAEPC